MFAFHEHTVVLPVIHGVNTDQILRNARVVFDAGADGVFLIDHNQTGNLRSWYDTLRNQHPDRFIGINILGLSVYEAFKQTPFYENLGGLWVDNGDYGFGVDMLNLTEEIVEMRENNEFLFFGGVAFKHQIQPRNLKKAAGLASFRMDVVTTSGDATGQPPSLEKIKTMHSGLESRDWLAIASGLTPENVANYVPYARYMIVSTGVSFPNSDGYTVDFNPELLEEFVKNAQK